jgi:hypothetical protein
MRDLAPNITRQKLLIEGFYKVKLDKKTIRDYFKKITFGLNLRTYSKPIIHSPSGKGKKMNQGYDAFVPLIDSGIYLGAWTHAKFLSIVLYTCKHFDVKKAVKVTKDFFKIEKIEFESF